MKHHNMGRDLQVFTFYHPEGNSQVRVYSGRVDEH